MFCRGGSVPPELELMRTLPAVYYVNTSPLEERVEVLLFEKKKIIQTIPQTFLISLILITIWNDQVQHSAMGSTVY